MKIVKLHLYGIIFVSIIFTTCLAAGDKFSFAAVVNAKNAGEMVLDDSIFSVSENVVVYTSAGVKSSMSYINTGDKVGVNFVDTANGGWMITEIHKLSSYYSINPNSNAGVLHGLKK